MTKLAFSGGDSLFVPVKSQKKLHPNVSLLDIQPLMNIVSFDEKNVKLNSTRLAKVLPLDH